MEELQAEKTRQAISYTGGIKKAIQSKISKIEVRHVELAQLQALPLTKAEVFKSFCEHVDGLASQYRNRISRHISDKGDFSSFPWFGCHGLNSLKLSPEVYCYFSGDQLKTEFEKNLDSFPYEFGTLNTATRLRRMEKIQAIIDKLNSEIQEFKEALDLIQS